MGVKAAPRRRWYLALAGCALGGFTAAAVAAAAGLPASGNPTTISFYKQSRAAMDRYEGIAFRGVGTSYKVVHQNGGDVFKFNFGTTPAGYRAAVAHVKVVQRKSVITEEVDTLVASGEPPLRLWLSAGTEVGELLTAKPCPELVPTNSASFTSVGHPFVVVQGTYAALQRSGSALSVVASSYPLGGGTARERDTIDTSTGLWKASHLLVVGGPNGGDSLGESGFGYRVTQRFIPVPTLGRCG